MTGRDTQHAVSALRIAIYSIAKDEHENVGPFMDSCKGADSIVVGVDPGDTTGELLEARGAQVVRVELPYFRFDSYRNAVLKKISPDIDVCVSMDLDETLQDGWRSIIEKAWVAGTTRLHYWLQWDEESRFLYDRIHARHGYEWRHANHEAVYAIAPDSEKTVQVDLVITQKQDDSKDRSKNLSLLELAVNEEPDSPRMNWYLGREYHMLGKHAESIKQFQYYLELRSVWGPERSWACIFVASCYKHFDYPMEQEAWLHAAIRNCPDLRDPYYELAQFYFDREEWNCALSELNAALHIMSNKHHFFHDNGAYTEEIHILKAHVLIELDDNNAAKRSLLKAQRISPEDQEIQTLLDGI